MPSSPTRRSILLGFLAAAASVPLGACSGDSTSDQGLSDKPVTLRFTWWGGDERQKRTQKVIDLFRKDHPNITVTGEFKDWNGYWDSLATTVAANSAPDIIQMDELYISSYAGRGALLDLGTQAKYLNTGSFDPNALAAGAIAGKQYALPVGLTAYSVVVNTDLLAKYNIAMPNDSTWTWDDLRSIGAEVSKASGGAITGVQPMGFDAGGLNVWARQAGASLYGDNGKVTIPVDVLASYWAYIVSLIMDGVASSPSVIIERANGGLNQSGTATNAAAFGTWWNTQLTGLSAASGQHLKLLKLPGEAKAKAPGAYYKPSMFWSVSSRSQHPAEAALFVDYLANSEAANNILLTERGIPANSKIRTSIAGQLSETDKAATAYLTDIKVGPAPRVTPKGASSVEAILKRHTEDVVFAKASPQQAAAAFIKELQAEIDAA